MGKKTVLFVFDDRGYGFDRDHPAGCPVLAKFKKQVPAADAHVLLWAEFLSTCSNVRADLLIITGTSHFIDEFRQLQGALAIFRCHNPGSKVTMASTQPNVHWHVNQLQNRHLVNLVGHGYDDHFISMSAELLRNGSAISTYELLINRCKSIAERSSGGTEAAESEK
jgi:hypothetical protein